MTNEEAHALSRKRGTSKLIYGTARVVLTPIAARLVPAQGDRRRVRAEGRAARSSRPTTRASTTRSSSGSRPSATCTSWPRPSSSRASPRGCSPASAPSPCAAARPTPTRSRPPACTSSDGRVLALFPEGTRHRDPEQLRSPRKGAGRLAIEAQAPIVPCAITGTDRLFAAGSRARSRSRSPSRPRSSPRSSRRPPRPPRT